MRADNENKMVNGKKQVVPIHPDGRYALVMPDVLTQEEVEKIRLKLELWRRSGEQFIVLAGDVALVRVDG